MLAFRKKLSPEQEAQRQIDIANEVQRQKDAEADRVRSLTYQNAYRRQAMWEAQVQAREDARLAEASRVAQEKADREERQRQQKAKEDAAKIAAYKEAKEAVDDLDRQIAGLQGRSDLAPLQAAELLGLRELRRVADGRLIEAERAIGRHRNGGS